LDDIKKRFRSAVFVSDEATNSVDRVAERIFPGGPLDPFKFNRIRIAEAKVVTKIAAALSSARNDA
jgi:hypothetical protein